MTHGLEPGIVESEGSTWENQRQKRQEGNVLFCPPQQVPVWQGHSKDNDIGECP